jgi:hypothetical protein
MPDGDTKWQLLLQRTGDLAPEQGAALEAMGRLSAWYQELARPDGGGARITPPSSAT